jgi:prepilin-type N-terminal cleavage/methylation domain-containing protein
MKPMNSKRGITLMELMVVIAIMGILSTVAMPKFFGTAEKAREKIDLMKLYDLRNALNLALIEDIGAMDVYDPVKSNTDGVTLSKRLNDALSSNTGATLFVIELHQKTSINVQGSHGSANNTYNICQMVGDAGTFYNALRDANFDGVAEIIADRLPNKANYVKDGGYSYSAKQFTNSKGQTFYRTAPNRKLFLSRALNYGKKDDNTRYSLSLRWSNPGDPYSVEVYMLENGKDWESAYESDYGTCFSTYGRKGCRYTNKKRK